MATTEPYRERAARLVRRDRRLMSDNEPSRVEGTMQRLLITVTVAEGLAVPLVFHAARVD